MLSMSSEGMAKGSGLILNRKIVAKVEDRYVTRAVVFMSYPISCYRAQRNPIVLSPGRIGVSSKRLGATNKSRIDRAKLCTRLAADTVVS